MTSADLRLSGGSVLVPDVGLVEADVLVSGGRIAGVVNRGATVAAAEVVEISGLTVLPGAVDAHVHLGQDITVPKTEEDVSLETGSAAAGGVTTLIAYLMKAEPYDTVFEAAVAQMEAHARIDFGFHFCIVTEEQLLGVSHYVRDLGVSSFKFFMNFRGGEGAYLGLPGNDDGFLYALLTATAGCGAMVNPHGENIEIIWRLRDGLRIDGMDPLRAWDALRPAFVEAEAQQRAAYLARAVGASLYAVHVTNAECLEALRRQREAYDRLYFETCPHYLTHDVDSDLGTIAKVNPPLRSPADREALWGALADGTIDVVGSDHVPRHRAAKVDDLLKASAGFPGLETLLPVLLSEGHASRGIPLERIVQVVASQPARIFGLYPRKGAIIAGADADFAIVDLKARWTVDASKLHSGAGYSIYDGWELVGRVVHTLVGGRFALKEGEIVGEPIGRFQRREQSGAAAIGVAT